MNKQKPRPVISDLLHSHLLDLKRNNYEMFNQIAAQTGIHRVTLNHMARQQASGLDAYDIYRVECAVEKVKGVQFHYHAGYIPAFQAA